MALQLNGKRAIVTGGIRGVGRAIPKSLADEGCNVEVCARDSNQISHAVNVLKSKGVLAFSDPTLERGDSDIRT